MQTAKGHFTHKYLKGWWDMPPVSTLTIRRVDHFFRSLGVRQLLRLLRLFAFFVTLLMAGDYFYDSSRFLCLYFVLNFCDHLGGIFCNFLTKYTKSFRVICRASHR